MALRPAPSEGEAGHIDDHGQIHAALNTMPYVDRALVSDGTTNDSDAFAAAVVSTAASSRALLLGGNTRLDTAVVLTTSTRLAGSPGAKITFGHGARGLWVKPVAEATGTVAAVAAGATTVTVTGAAWTVNQHAGKWVEILDAATTATNRRVLSNTADTLTVDHAVGTAIAGGTAANFYTPIEEVVIDDITFDRAVTGTGANIEFTYIKNLILRRVRSNNAGTYGGTAGNGISIYHCDRVRMVDVGTKLAGQFGCFIYNCDDVRIWDYTCDRWGGQFGMQLKDCRNARVYTSTGVGDGTLGDHAFNIKCSGLNPSYDVQLVGCHGEKSVGGSDFEFSSITKTGGGDGGGEGDYFSARNYKAIACTSRLSLTAGFSHVIDAGATPTGWEWVDCVADEAYQIGFVPAAGMTITRPIARRCGFEGVTVAAADVTVRGGVMEDNVQRYTTGATRSSEIYATSSKTLLEGVTFKRTAAGKALRAVRDNGLSTNLLIKDPRIIESVAAYSQDYLVTGAGGRIVGHSEVDTFTGAPTINKKPAANTVLTATATINFPNTGSGLSATGTIPLPGAVVGDSVILGPPAAIEAGLSFVGFVSATDTVTVRMTNVSGAAIDAVPATWRATISK